MTQNHQGFAIAGPWIHLSWQARDRHRLVTAVAFAGLVAAAAMAMFGLPPVDLHGPFHRLGIMDPLCGGTRAARYTAEGQWALAWEYNPLGIITVLGAVTATARTATGVLLGRWLTADFSWTPRRRRLALGVLAVLLIILEVRQQLRADLLMAGT